MELKKYIFYATLVWFPVSLQYLFNMNVSLHALSQMRN